MELYIVRHGIAEPREAEGVPSDAERALTPRGQRRTREVADGLRLIGSRVDRIFASPLVRAEQTARIIADVLQPGAPVEATDALLPGAAVEGVVELLKGRDDEAVMIVGHMPDVAEIAGDLLCEGGEVDMVFKKAAVCRISFDGPAAADQGRLDWLLQARHLRAIASDAGSMQNEPGQ